jgi:hypothetical protein
VVQVVGRRPGGGAGDARDLGVEDGDALPFVGQHVGWCAIGVGSVPGVAAGPRENRFGWTFGPNGFLIRTYLARNSPRPHFARLPLLRGDSAL